MSFFRCFNSVVAPVNHIDYAQAIGELQFNANVENQLNNLTKNPSKAQALQALTWCKSINEQINQLNQKVEADDILKDKPRSYIIIAGSLYEFSKEVLEVEAAANTIIYLASQ